VFRPALRWLVVRRRSGISRSVIVSLSFQSWRFWGSRLLKLRARRAPTSSPERAVSQPSNSSSKRTALAGRRLTQALARMNPSLKLQKKSGTELSRVQRAMCAVSAVCILYSFLTPWPPASWNQLSIGVFGSLAFGLLAALGNKTRNVRMLTALILLVFVVALVRKLSGAAT
jgi:hypothetical protein